MDTKKFKLWNKVVAAVVFAVAAVTYLSTIEPSASFWDCGEFIASSYKLEVGHPPGNPTFQIFARLFTMFGDGADAALLVNSMSALCSALTILFLYLTIVFFAKRMVKKEEGGEYSTVSSLVIFGSGAVGALAYCFSDTFWFSAVEGEVYAMSSLFTAVVFWAMTRWYETADEPYSNRWIVLICFLMGLSIGVHLLNLLAIPAIVFMYYYKKRENGAYSGWETLGIVLLSVVILALIFFVIVPYMPKLAAYFDLFFVNVLGLPYNTGAVFFLLAVLALCFWGLFRTLKKNKVFLNTALLCFTTIVIGFSTFSLCIIRSSVKTPTNEYQPDNAFTLVRYLSREQYGKNPLLYGQYFDAPFDIKTGTYWAPIDGKYKKVESPADTKYKASGKMFFPRMWSASPDGRNQEFYACYMGDRGKKVAGATYKKPTFFDNLSYFFDYQLNWMYWRYFMWNFAGRQNEIHSPDPGNIFHGNWECGIRFIDEFRLGDQTDAPASLKENEGKNHYFMLPLLLGILGLFFQFAKDKRGCWLVTLMFVMTGIAIVVYLNQPPYQVRERDYAYAGSFYAFCIWIGFAVTALYSWLTDIPAIKKHEVATASVVILSCLCVPALMAQQNWDDHDRSNRRTAAELGYNYLNSVGPNGILITHGDNDTFPLWYDQEVESVRTDVRICNTSLLGTDWHIDQMKYAVNESAPLDLSVPLNQYLYGTNEWVYIYDTRNMVIPLKDVMAVFRHPDVKLPLSSGKKVDYIISRRFSIPVDKENCLKYGIVPQKFADMIPDEIVLEIPESKEVISKQELFMLDLLSNYKWDRPINLLNQGGDLDMGIKSYLMYDGFSSRFTPLKNTVSSSSIGLVDADHLYGLIKDTFSWENISRDDYFVDYQNKYTFMGVMSIRGLFANCVDALMKEGENDKALEILDMGCNILPRKGYPLDGIPIGLSGADFMTVRMIDSYYRLGQVEKARSLALDLSDEMLVAINFYLQFFEYAKHEVELCSNYIYFIDDTLKKNGDAELAGKISAVYNQLVESYSSTKTDPAES